MNKRIIAAIVVVIAAILVVKFVFLDRNRDMLGPERIETKPVPEERRTEIPEKESEPPIRYPISEIRVDVQPRDELEMKEEKPLPPLAESDEALHQSLSDMETSEQLDELIIFDAFIRRFVVTVDNLSRDKLPQKYRFVEEVPGNFLVQKNGGDNRYVLDPENYERYSAFIDLAEVMDLRLLVQVYTRFYPLFQEAYEDLGYPDRYFNDRVIEVIDELLATPRVQGRVELIRPKVFYQFADPDLERLSAGQKILIRMGPINAERIKARLQALRRLLVNQ